MKTHRFLQKGFRHRCSSFSHFCSIVKRHEDHEVTAEFSSHLLHVLDMGITSCKPGGRRERESGGGGDAWPGGGRAGGRESSDSSREKS